MRSRREPSKMLPPSSANVWDVIAGETKPEIEKAKRQREGQQRFFRVSAITLDGRGVRAPSRRLNTRAVSLNNKI